MSASAAAALLPPSAPMTHRERSASSLAEGPKLGGGKHITGADAWKRKVASADPTGSLLEQLAKTARAEQAMFDIQQANRRVKKIKPGARTIFTPHQFITPTFSSQRTSHGRQPRVPS
eukprot:SAG11_NODE_3697_length_2274_cov_1.792644_3_plen_118_part_00